MRPNAFGLVGDLNNAVAPGKRPASSMTPLIAVGADGTVLCAGGSGGPTIVTGVVQTVINVIDFHMNVEAAVSSPRVHAQYIPDSVLVEPEISADALEGLRRRGHKVVVTPAPLETAVQVAMRRPAGAATAAPAASQSTLGSQNRRLTDRRQNVLGYPADGQCRLGSTQRRDSRRAR